LRRWPRTWWLLNTALRFSSTEAGIYRRPPILDEHREELLTELEKNQ